MENPRICSFIPANEDDELQEAELKKEVFNPRRAALLLLAETLLTLNLVRDVRFIEAIGAPLEHARQPRAIST
jgi:hypothetical protein